jgi:hypothetical protein
MIRDATGKVTNCSPCPTGKTHIGLSVLQSGGADGSNSTGLNEILPECIIRYGISVRDVSSRSSGVRAGNSLK